MGLFGSKKTYVSAVVYNMSGDVNERMNYLKTVVVGGVLSNTKFSMAECLSNNYLTGPGIKARSFHRWSKRTGNYDIIGVPTVNIFSPSYNPATVMGNIPLTSGHTASYKKIDFGPGEASYFAEQWVMENYQERVGLNWVSTYDYVADEITIHWEDYPGSPSVFTPSQPIDNGSYYYYTVYEERAGGSFLGSYMWIYKVGDGITAMDDMPIFNPLVDEFMTFIPFRMGNEFISDDWKPEFYPYVKKAYKKLTGGKKLSELVEMVADNEDLDDIDRAYVMPGVALNHPDRSARRYLFRFFDFLKDASLSYDTDWDSYVGDYASYQSDNTTYKDGRVLYLDTPIEGGGGGGEGGGTGDPANTTPSPAEPAEPLTAIDIRSSGSWDGNFHMQMKWNSITKTTGSGIKSGSPSGTKTGDVWWGVSSEVDLNSEINFINHVVTSDRKSTTVQLTWQFADHWETLEIKGLKHKNIIKNGESADVKAKDALEDEEESAFLVPIHYETFRSLSLVDSTQMMTCCTYAVFTCYEVVKQKWYQTAFFKIIVFVVIIALTVFLGPEIGIAAGGILGSSAAVGAALGFAGLMAVLVGAIANAIAAMVLMAILQKVGTAVFGDKIGAIIAAVAGAIAMAVGGGLMNGQSMSAMWGNMMSAVNIIHMTAAVGNGIAGYIQGSAQEMMVKTQEMMAQYEKDSKRIQDMFVKEFGMGDFHWDPNMLTNTNFGGVSEIPQCFLDRTLLTGGDIAEMSLNMVRDFADMTLNLNTMGS